MTNRDTYTNSNIETSGGNEGTLVAYGRGRATRLATDVAGLSGEGSRVILIADPEIAQADLLQGVSINLAASGCEVWLNTSIAGEPKAKDVDTAIEQARDHRADIVVAVGGGSVIDVAKLVGALAVDGQGVGAYGLGAKAFPDRRLPVIAVPTTAGTGAEVTRTSIFAAPDGTKLWAWGEGLHPEVAVLDPELTVTLPRGLTVATGVDALVHAVEATTNRTFLPGIDLPAMQAIGLVRRYLPRAVAQPDDLEARGAMLRAACLAGRAIDRAGTGVAHALGHALGSLAGVPHGRAVALGLDAALSWNAEAAPDRHAAVADAFGLQVDPTASDEALADELAAVFNRFLRELELPVSLAGDGLAEKDAERVAEATLRPENAPMLQANCRHVGEAEALSLSRALLTAD
ncbi:iron-containing alcohol dehydrogenase [Ferruginivarius sediminum]|uniref:Iron-containing alcohol dehydrogenase n=1 Tax=Ferruginivarius sediminum TaxID=2661937 RepID=A0A369TEJ0_9PROT|nr:iron-containing alcohol dehydrogenase [Ferruginivarius sediminum]RDD63771.1 iron-containing alcohol dehydrogenase [Ferruginivarius sediminum]